VWNVTLVIVTFFLTIFGTFMTRSGIVQSVHAFGEDRALATMFAVFMAILLVVSFGLLFYRLPLLRARHELDSWASREAAFLANNWILLFSALFVLFATMFPTLSEAVTGERLTVGPPFFNRWMLPIGLLLLVLTGIGPLMAWRKSTLANLKDQFLWPVSLGLVTFVALWAAGARVLTSGVCFGLCAFVTGTVSQEFWRGGRVRQNATGSDIVTAIIGLVARSHRRYGGYIVHLGIVLMFLGFAGEGYKVEEQVLLNPGQRVELGGFAVQHDALRLTDDGQKQMITAHVSVEREGRAAGTMEPAKWFFRKHEDEPTTEVAIRRGFWEDLYIVLAAFDTQTQSATLHVVVNPLVNWIWMGFGLLALGTFIALLPERSFAFAAARVPASASTATLLALLLVLPASTARAQHVETAQSAASVVIPRSALERELGREIICMCGTCGRQLVGECSCSEAARMREEIAQLVGRGLTKDQVLQYYVEKYGSQLPLASPIDEGFNRLAWLFPYLVGGTGALAVALFTRRWTRRERPAARPDDRPARDPALEEKLDDELRNLD
jgi:cytochrome c-type biogenesis protein CcmF